MIREFRAYPCPFNLPSRPCQIPSGSFQLPTRTFPLWKSGFRDRPAHFNYRHGRVNCRSGHSKYRLERFRYGNLDSTTDRLISPTVMAVSTAVRAITTSDLNVSATVPPRTRVPVCLGETFPPLPMSAQPGASVCGSKQYRDSRKSDRPAAASTSLVAASQKFRRQSSSAPVQPSGSSHRLNSQEKTSSRGYFQADWQDTPSSMSLEKLSSVLID
jgi:hypothetical protein